MIFVSENCLKESGAFSPEHPSFSESSSGLPIHHAT